MRSICGEPATGDVLGLKKTENVNSNANSSSSSAESEGSTTGHDDDTKVEDTTADVTKTAESSESGGVDSAVSASRGESARPTSDDGGFSALLTDSIAVSDRYDYPKATTKNYGLDLAGELRAKLQELRVQYDVLKYKHTKSKARCDDLEAENKRLQKQLELHNKHQINSDQALLKHTTEINEMRVKFREVKAELDQVRLEVKKASGNNLKDSKRSRNTKRNDSKERVLNVHQINNNRKPSTLLRHAASQVDHRQLAMSHARPYNGVLNSNRKEPINEPTIILNAPVIGGRTKAQSSNNMDRRMRAQAISGPRRSSRNSRNRTVVLTNVIRSNHIGAGPASVKRAKSTRRATMRNRMHQSRLGKRRPSARHEILEQRLLHKPMRRSHSTYGQRARSVPTAYKRHTNRRMSSKKTAVNMSNNNPGPVPDSSKAIAVLNCLLSGVHFNPSNNLFYPGKLADTEKAHEGVEEQHIALDPAPPPIKPRFPCLRKQSKTGPGWQTVGRVQYNDRVKHNDAQFYQQQTLKMRLDALNKNTKLNSNEKYIKGLYKTLLLADERYKHPMYRPKALNLNINNNAGSSDEESDEYETSDQPPNPTSRNTSTSSRETTADRIMGDSVIAQTGPAHCTAQKTAMRSQLALVGCNGNNNAINPILQQNIRNYNVSVTSRSV